MLMKVNYTDGDLNLLKVAQALRESHAPDNFTMSHYGECGTPACALGHYAHRTDLQDVFYLAGGVWAANLPDIDGRAIICDGFPCTSPAVQQHFGITKEEAYRLFNTHGCGFACSANQAADYIEKFVSERIAARSEIPW